MKAAKKSNEMRAEYDFSKVERGKFYRPLDKGYTVHVTKADGTTVVNHYTLAEGTVLLAPDVLEYFSDSESVNEALRSLIQLMEKVPARKYKMQRSAARQVAERK
jgi:ketopantoate hydroxymethyltransferase